MQSWLQSSAMGKTISGVVVERLPGREREMFNKEEKVGPETSVGPKGYSL